MLRRDLVVPLLALAALVLGASGCTLPTTDDGGGYGPSAVGGDRRVAAPATARKAAPTVLRSGVATRLEVRDSQWTPAAFQAAPGTAIALEVVNADASQHNFTLEGAQVSRNLPSGGELLLEFSAPGPGRHRFYCKYLHQEMQGWITVK